MEAGKCCQFIAFELCRCVIDFRIATPIRVARQVLEQSPHSFIVGAGAQQFAVSHGFTVEQLKPTELPKICTAITFSV